MKLELQQTVPNGVCDDWAERSRVLYVIALLQRMRLMEDGEPMPVAHVHRKSVSQHHLSIFSPVLGFPNRLLSHTTTLTLTLSWLWGSDCGKPGLGKLSEVFVQVARS
jgi:hypothetical protein